MIRPLLLALLCAAAPVTAQTVPPGYEVARWHRFRTAAVSYTFDDSTPNQLPVAVPLFDEFGYKLTLYPVTGAAWGWPASWTGLAQAAANGHEVGSHSVSHPHRADIGGTQQLAELRDSHDAIASNVPASGRQTFAYPYCERWTDSAVLLYYFAARGCQGAVNPPTPADFLNISSIIVGENGSIRNAQSLNAQVAAAFSPGGWVVYLVHGVDGDGGWSSVPSSEIRTHLEFMRDNEATYWIQTFGHVVRYIRERNAAVVTELSADAEAMTLSLSDGLADFTYDVPLSLRRELPDGWTGASVEQAGSLISSSIVTVDEMPTVQFDAVPDAGDITIRRSGTTGIGSAELPQGSTVLGTYPNPADARVTLDYRVGRDAFVTLEVFDLLGRRVRTLISRFLAAGSYSHDWETAGFRPGPYLVRLTSASDVDSGVLVVR
jgi:oligosaccharide reducing-end xylanase